MCCMVAFCQVPFVLVLGLTVILVHALTLQSSCSQRHKPSCWAVALPAAHALHAV